MKIHVMQSGEIVEHVIRRNNVSISELSRKLNVSRRSIYNWFTQKNLSLEVVCKIGEALGHDFSAEFPEMFEQIHSVNDNVVKKHREEENTESVEYWRNKYINLLEKHNDFLSHNATSTFVTVLIIISSLLDF